jgi:hypothetical protein
MGDLFKMFGGGMQDRRIETRMLCADLIEVLWKEGRARRAIVNLEDISSCGACIQHDEAIPIGTALRLRYPDGEFTGTVRHCAFREIGFFIGIEFSKSCRWSPKVFRPKYMVDPRSIKSYREQEEEETVPLVARAAVVGGLPRKPPGSYVTEIEAPETKWTQPITFMRRMAARLTE